MNEPLIASLARVFSSAVHAAVAPRVPGPEEAERLRVEQMEAIYRAANEDFEVDCGRSEIVPTMTLNPGVEGYGGPMEARGEASQD